MHCYGAGWNGVEKTNASGTPPSCPTGAASSRPATSGSSPISPGNFPDGALLVPGTRWLLVVDTGYTTHSVRAVNTATLRASPVTNPVASSISYDPPKALDWGMAYVAASKLLYVASGYQSPNDTASQIYAYDFDTTSGQLTADAAQDGRAAGGHLPRRASPSRPTARRCSSARSPTATSSS